MRIFARYKRHTMKKNFHILSAILLGLLFFSTCHNKPQTPVQNIDELKRQLVTDSTTLYNLKTTDFQQLEKDFTLFDAKLQDINPEQVQTVFEQLNLTQAYLRQFEEVSPDMHQKMTYSLLQLERLKADIENHYLPDSLANVYLETETKIADTLHNRVVYFRDRFNLCKKEMEALKKNHQHIQ